MGSDALDQRFTALTGFAPYRWQRRLYAALIAGEAIDALDLPTGLGKTSVMPLWLLARAAGARLPRRLVYVVDRRAVVDQATAVAETIARNLGPDAGGVAADIRADLGLSVGAALPVSTLRGQYADNRRWLENPAATAIIVGTVDMIGSRLLFEGYGVSRGMRPVHAGFLGADSLFLIDEAHLVPPFEALLRQAAVMGAAQCAAAPNPISVPPRSISLSATGKPTSGLGIFRLDEADRTDAPVSARLAAPKRLTVAPDASPSDLVPRLADEAWRLGAEGRRIVVFCNSRKTAQAVERDLAKRVDADKGRFGKGARLTELLVGERRYRERLRLGDSPVFARFQPGTPPDPDGLPAFIVATSAGEVGIDLDGDDLVCDLVAWERMVQRLGRVNRRAEPGLATVTVIPSPPDKKDKDAEDEFAEDTLRLYRAPFDSALWEMGEDGAKDASPAALLTLKRNPDFALLLDAATTREPLRPALTRPILDSWSLTSLDQHPGRPKVQPWLRGWAKVEPQTVMVWRRLFPLHPGEETRTPSRELKIWFESAAPPHLSESLSAPSWRAAQALRECAGMLTKASQKVGGTQAPGLGHQPVVVLLNARRELEDLYTVERLAEANVDGLARDFANATVVIDARFGGLDENGLLDSKAKAEPDTLDMADQTAWGLPLDKTAGRRITCGQKPDRDPTSGWRLEDFQWSVSDADDAPGLWIEVWRRGGQTLGDPAIGLKSRALALHHDDTGRHARRIADGLGLVSPWRDVLIAAAEAHDLGKDRELWQNAMNAPRDGRPYAKTQGGGDGRRLSGYRHEFGSLRDVAAPSGPGLPAIVTEDPGRLDLCLHLIVAHHGWARPAIKAYDPIDPPSRSEPLARETALRFARLQAQWGPWGLAWWEGLMRAADWAASRAVNEEGAANG